MYVCVCVKIRVYVHAEVYLPLPPPVLPLIACCRQHKGGQRTALAERGQRCHGRIDKPICSLLKMEVGRKKKKIRTVRFWRVSRWYRWGQKSNWKVPRDVAGCRSRAGGWWPASRGRGATEFLQLKQIQWVCYLGRTRYATLKLSTLL